MREGSSPNAYLRAFLADIARTARARTALAIGLMAVSSCFEGVALMMLFPLLGLIGLDTGGGLERIANSLTSVMSSAGIAVTAVSVGVLLLLLTVLQHMCSVASAWIASGVQVRFIARYRQELTNAFLEVEWLQFTRENIGNLSHVFSIETRRAGDLVNYGLQIVSLSFTAAIYLAVAFVASWKVTLILILGGGLVLALSQVVARRPGLLTGRQVQLFSLFSSQSSEVLNGMKLIRAMNGSATVRRLIWPTVEQLQDVERKVLVQPVLLKSSFELSALIVLVSALIYVTAGSISDVATVLLITALFVRFYPRVSTIQQLVHHFRISIPYYAAVVDTLARARAAAEKHAQAAGGREVISRSPTIEFHNVTVLYDERPALQDVSLVIPPRQTVGIAGPSGAGKSTLVDTLLRLVPVHAGSITMDGVDISDIDISRWRNSVGYIPQDTFLFNASIRDNIVFSQSNLTHEDLEEAARKAQLTEFIRSLPNGYDTVVGDRGVRLSGGLRQRVGIARALIGGKSLLVLDEATAALDSGTEASIMADLAALRGEVTIVMIAHRLSTLRAADKIIVLDAGKVVETGSWSSLVAGDGVFRKLWDIQTEVAAGSPSERVATSIEAQSSSVIPLERKGLAR